MNTKTLGSARTSHSRDRCNTLKIEKHFIAIFHGLFCKESTRIDFDSELDETAVYEKLKLEEYKIYQFIHHDFLFNMDIPELDIKDIDYDKLARKKRIWFGLGQKTVYDILIRPREGFYYPHQYGHYFYLFSKHRIDAGKFEDWLNANFPDRFGDYEDFLVNGISNDFNLLNPEDYLLITNHDFQKQFGVAGKKEIVERLIERLTNTFKTDIVLF